MSDEVSSILERYGAVIRDSHIVYTSGRHGSTYINKDAIYPHIRAVSRLCALLADPFTDRRIEVVAAPAIGGVILSQGVARHLSDISRNFDILAVYAEKDEAGDFAFRRGYDRLVAGRRVLVIEDILTTGGSLKAVIAAVAGAGGKIVGVGALVNRGGTTAEAVGSSAGLFVLASIDQESWDETECPLCRDGVSVNTEVGKGREYLARMRGHS